MTSPHANTRDREPRVGCKDPRSSKIPHDHAEHGRIGHPKNLINQPTGIHLIYDPINYGWFRFGCSGKDVGVKPATLATHIFSRRDAEIYLDSVISELRAGKIKVSTNSK